MNFFNRFKYVRDSYVVTLLIVGILCMVAFLAERHFFRFDLTEDKEYAISDASKDIMHKLDDIVTIKVFFSDKLPPNLFAVRQYIEDLLSELSTYAKGNLEVQFPTMRKKENIEEAKLLGIPMVRMNIFEKDKFEVTNGFLGIAVSYGGRHELLPIVQDTLNLEYDLMSAVKKLVSPNRRTIGFLVGHNEYPIDRREGDSYFSVSTELSKNYDVIQVDLNTRDALKGVNTLIVGGPQIAFSDKEKSLLDDYLIKGGTLIMLLDGVDVNDALSAQKLNLDLDDQLASYGATVDHTFVLDRSNATASFAQGYVNFIVPYPFWVKATSDNFNKISPIMSKLDSFVLPWTSPILITQKPDITPTILAFTTSEAWIQDEPFNLDPNLGAPEGAQTSQQALAVLLEGTFRSFFESDKDSAGMGRLLLIGNSRFITDRVVNEFEQNMNFFLNAVDFLTLDESLIGIRSKAVSDRPLRELSDQERQLVKYAVTFLMPLLVIAYGLLRSVYRRRKKFKLVSKS